MRVRVQYSVTTFTVVVPGGTVVDVIPTPKLVELGLLVI
jgi:hypothetical protein